MSNCRQLAAAMGIYLCDANSTRFPGAYTNDGNLWVHKEPMKSMFVGGEALRCPGDEEWPNTDYPRRSHGVAESCHFCAHLLDAGGQPACVEACEREGARALIFGDLNDPESEIARIVELEPVKRIREDWGTQPKVYYLGI